MPTSPPQEAPEFRSRNLTPVSPKPLLFPSPANIPILEMQMEPDFNGSINQAAPADLHQDDPPTDPPSSNSSIYADNAGGQEKDGQEQTSVGMESNDDY